MGILETASREVTCFLVDNLSVRNSNTFYLNKLLMIHILVSEDGKNNNNLKSLRTSVCVTNDQNEPLKFLKCPIFNQC